MTSASPSGTLREMSWRDLPAVMDLEEQSYPATAWSEATWWGELAGRPRRTYIVHLEVGGEVTGYAGVDVGADSADVMTITVAQTQRGAGVGTLLLHELHRQATRRGARQILLEVRADNVAAQRLYARSGYRTISRRRGYYPPDGVDAVVLRADLRSGFDGAADTQPAPEGGVG